MLLKSFEIGNLKIGILENNYSSKVITNCFGENGTKGIPTPQNRKIVENTHMLSRSMKSSFTSKAVNR